jgi:hypothetical protein
MRWKIDGNAMVEISTMDEPDPAKSKRQPEDGAG